MSTVASSSKGSGQMEVNPRGIPKAPFVDNVEAYVGGADGEIEITMKKFQETSAKYRYMEVNLSQRRKGLEVKIPDIQQTLTVVQFLQNRRLKSQGEAVEEEVLSDDEDEDELDDLYEKDGGGEKKKGGPLKTLFELNDTLFAEAEVEENGQVGIWLGANTMLLYPLQEAIDLLSGKLASAKKNLSETIEDLEWLREQATVMEVNFARVHNWDVKRRREAKARGEETEEKDDEKE